MIEHTLPLGPFQTNGYILGCQKDKVGVVIDPGFEAERILAKAAEDDLTIQAILLTHGHVDHVSAVAEVKQATGAPVYIHPDERPIYLNAPQLGRMFGLSTPQPPEPDHDLAEGDEIRFGQHLLKVIHTPGHSPGGVCFHCQEERLLIAGDTLFWRGIGRTDLPGGSTQVLFDSIQRRIYTLDEATRVLPGHGPATTVRDEKLGNPFVRA